MPRYTREQIERDYLNKPVRIEFRSGMVRESCIILKNDPKRMCTDARTPFVTTDICFIGWTGNLWNQIDVCFYPSQVKRITLIDKPSDGGEKELIFDKEENK